MKQNASERLRFFMVEATSNSIENRVTVSNNAAKYYSDLAKSYLEQASEYASIAKDAEAEISSMIQAENLDTVIDNLDKINLIAENIDNLGIGSAEWGKITGDVYIQTDLASIINAKANTADLPEVATTGVYADLLEKPENVSAFINDVGYLTQDEFTEQINNLDFYTKSEMDSMIGDISSLLDSINGEVQ